MHPSPQSGYRIVSSPLKTPSCYPLVVIRLHPITPATTGLSFVPMVLFFWEYYINGIIKYGSFWDWALLHCLWDSPKLLNVLKVYSFLLLSTFPLSFIKGHLGCFQFLGVMNRAAKTFGTDFCVNISFHFSRVAVGGEGIVGSYSEYIFNFLRNCQPFFHCCYIICISNSNVWEFHLFHITDTISILNLAILTGM